jgi:hypothetical protein
MPNKADEKKSRTRGLKVVALTAGLVLIGGVAFAYWTQGGAGTGSATTAAGSLDVTVKQTTNITTLAPGVSPIVLSGNFDNPNPGPVYVTSVTVGIASVTPVGAPGSCTASDYTLAGTTTMPVGQDVPAGNGKGSWTGATIAFNNKASNQDGCKGATVNFTYTAN